MPKLLYCYICDGPCWLDEEDWFPEEDYFDDLDDWDWDFCDDPNCRYCWG